MVIYSESFHVEYAVEKEWVQWVTNILIPEIYKTQKFSKVVFSKVISHSDETGVTYSIQYYAIHKKDLEDYYKHYSNKEAELLFDKFDTRVLSFKTELEVIETFEF